MSLLDLSSVEELTQQISVALTILKESVQC